MFDVFKRLMTYGAAMLAALMLCTMEVQAAPELMPDGEYFDAEYYAKAYPDVRAVCGNARDALYSHYLVFGKKEGRHPYDPALEGNIAASELVTSDLTPIAVTYSSPLQAYFARSVFIGDSIMVGYHNHLAYNKTSNLAASQFLAKVSYSATHANNVVDKLHPPFMGVSQPLWTSLSMMDVDRVFIMFGTNDLVSFSPEVTVERISTLVDKIKESCPKLEINIISMTPVFAGTSKGYLSNLFIAQYNELMTARCLERGWGFVNLYPGLIGPTGDLIPEYSSDHYVHLTNRAYSEVWDVVLSNHAIKKLGEAGRTEVRGREVQ